MSRPAVVPLVVLALVWGSSYLFIDIALRGYDPSVVAFVRQLVGAAILLPVAWRTGRLHTGGAGTGWILLASVVTVTGPTLLIGLGQQSVSPSVAGILVSSTPVLAALAAVALRDADRPGPARLAGVLVGMIGIVLIFGVDLRGRDAVGGGALLVLASAGYAVGGRIVQRRLRSTPPLGLAAYGSAVSAVVLAPFAALSLPDAAPGAGPTLALVELGVVGTALGWVLYYGLIHRLGAQRASLSMYLAPIASVAIGVAVGGDALRVVTVAGLALVLLGSWIAAGAGGRSVSSGAPPPPP